MRERRGRLGYGAPLLHASCGRERCTWEAMLLRKEQAAMAAPPGGRSRPPLPRPPPPFSFLPAPWAGGVVPFSGRGWESLLTLPSAQRRCAEADGCPTVQGRGGGRAAKRARRAGAFHRQAGGRSGVPGVRESRLGRRGRFVRYRWGLGRERGDMSTCSVSKVRGEGALSNRRSGRDGSGRVGRRVSLPPCRGGGGGPRPRTVAGVPKALAAPLASLGGTGEGASN